MNNSMINPSIVNLLEKVDNRYSLVVANIKKSKTNNRGRRANWFKV